MIRCAICGERKASATLHVCADCIRRGKGMEYIEEAHAKIRAAYKLVSSPPKTKGGITCGLCANECKMGEGERGYCGLRANINGRLVSSVPEGYALMHVYYDPLPTNCCAAWFCPGSSQSGKVNVAVFFYGCNFNCIFCQNETHKNLAAARAMSEYDFVSAVLRRENAYCICYFGGSPEPQLPFAIHATRRILEERERDLRICWEWNGCGSTRLVRQAAELSLASGGIVKFDLKAFNPNLSLALSGVPNERAYENFKLIADEFFAVSASASSTPVLTATTLLVPFYVDAQEVENIARFIADIDPRIPYSLLVFHPAFYMRDMPVTPREQVLRCYEAAKRHLKYVNIGNKHLLSLSRVFE